jgi:hypothetical protein
MAAANDIAAVIEPLWASASDLGNKLGRTSAPFRLNGAALRGDRRWLKMAG